ncbi:Protein required for damage to oral epithelial cells and for normal hyphal growth and stress resistance [Candida albicans P75010]|nr:Protein required for damage to oral epithelial cells and for normal hyphal growth and stress resistance [Candida albicans P75010]
MPMYVYVVVIICFLPPSFSLNYLPRRTLKLNLLVVVVVVLSYIYVYSHISLTFFFFFFNSFQ